MNLLMLSILTVAAARATFLVTDDKLPFGYLREWLERPSFTKASNAWTRGDRVRNWLGEGMSCTHCVSVHTGFWSAVLATYADWAPVNGWGDWPTFMVTWFAISGAVVLLESLHFWLLGDD